MDLFVQATDDSGKSYWLFDDDGTSAMIHEFSSWVTGDVLATSFKSVKSAKKAMTKARKMMNFSGSARVKVTAMRFVNGKLVETKFTKDNKIKY